MPGLREAAVRGALREVVRGVQGDGVEEEQLEAEQRWEGAVMESPRLPRAALQGLRPALQCTRAAGLGPARSAGQAPAAQRAQH